MSESYTGSCNCGGVRYGVTGELSDIIVCHCGQCRKQTGLYYATIQIENENFHLHSDTTLSWYPSSDKAERGFCHRCGSALFWRPLTHSHISILAGTLEGDIPSVFAKHIYCNDKANFYKILDDAPQFDHTGNPLN